MKQQALIFDLIHLRRLRRRKYARLCILRGRSGKGADGVRVAAKPPSKFFCERPMLRNIVCSCWLA